MDTQSRDQKYPVFKFRIPPDQFAWLRQYARQQGIPMSQVVKGCLTRLQQEEKQAQPKGYWNLLKSERDPQRLGKRKT
jgi:hypothetical protein